MPGEGLLGSLHDCYDRTDTRLSKELAGQLKGQNVVIVSAGRGRGFSAGAASALAIFVYVQINYHDFKNVAEGKTHDLRYISATAEGEDKSAQNAVGLLGDIEWDTPYLAGGMVTVLPSGQLDFLSGRYVDCKMKVEDLESRKDATLEHDWYRVQLNSGEGVLPRLGH